MLNEVLRLHVQNQQEYKLVVDHAFVDVLELQWSLHAMVLHTLATKKERHCAVHVVFADKSWLYDDARVKGEHPPPKSAKATILLYNTKEPICWY